MQDGKSGAGYGNHGGDDTFEGGQDGEKSKDHQAGKANERLDSGDQSRETDEKK